MNVFELAARTVKQLERAKALVEVNSRIMRISKRLVKKGWSPEYVGVTLLGAGIDMLQASGIRREAILDGVNKAFESYDVGKTKSAFKEPDAVSDSGDTEEA
jgi:hypothetical protein